MMGFMLKARESGVRLWLDTTVTGIETEPANTGTAGVPHAAPLDRASVLPADGKAPPLHLKAASSQRGAGGTPAVPVGSVERRITGVRTTRGLVSTPIVVNAAGAWAAGVARLAGAELPSNLRRQLVPHEPLRQLAAALSGGHRHVYQLSLPQGKGILLAWNDPAETRFQTEFDTSFIERF
jgi:hypothetical protein